MAKTTDHTISIVSPGGSLMCSARVGETEAPTGPVVLCTFFPQEPPPAVVEAFKALAVAWHSFAQDES